MKSRKRKRKPRHTAARSRAAGPRDVGVRDLIEVFSNWYYWEQDQQHRYVRVTGSILKKTGTDARMFLGKSVWELGTVPVDDDGSWDKIRAVLDSHQLFTDFLFTFPAPKGEVRYISASGQPLFDAKKKFLGYRGISRDVTTRIRTERRRTIEQAVSRILANSNSIDDAATEIIRGICKVLGWTCGAYWVFDAQSQTLRCGETWGERLPGVHEFLTATRRLSLPATPARGVVAQTWLRGEPQWVEDAIEAGVFPRGVEASQAGLRGGFAFPIKVDANTIGVMEFYSLGSLRPDTELLSGAVNLGASIGEFCQRKQAEEQLLRFHTAMDVSGDPIYLVDRQTMCYIDFNETACRLTGYTRAELLKLGPADLSPSVGREEFEREYDGLIAKPDEVVTAEYYAQGKHGRSTVEARRRAVRIGNRWVIVSVARDVTQRKRSERAALRISRMFAALSATNEAIMRVTSTAELYQRVCDAAVDGGKFITTAVMLPKQDGRQVTVAAAAGEGGDRLRAAAISFDPATAEGRGLVGTAYRSRQPAVSSDFLADERTRPWHARAGANGVASAAAVPLLKGDSAVGVLLFISGDRRSFDDETVKLLERLAENVVFALDNLEREAERKRSEERIQYLATHDGLTGLPNRVLFGELLARAIESARRYERKFAVLFLDLDRFKLINDSLGHEAGDALLKEMADRLKVCVRASDVVARFGGDEFVLLVQEIDDLEQVAGVARKVLSAVLRPMSILGQECRVTGSIGISVYPADADDEQSLMKNADIAMYLAKDEGKNNFVFYSKNVKSQSLERLKLEASLRNALERNEFSLHYQAKLHLKSGAISGVEALLRWNNPDLGNVSPAQFIPLAEETGLIVPIGKWVLNTACEQNVAWQRAGLPAVCMAVNLSARQFADANLLDDIGDALRHAGMAAQLLELEITEGVVIHNPERAVRLLTAISELGVRLAIDDFGTGYSSLGQLKNYPIDTLKVDRSFIREIPWNVEDSAITEAIIAMGKTLSLTVVAEGVETEEQETFLRQHGCDETQGYYFSRPVVPREFAELLRRHVPDLQN